jgi:hypothetical protein
MWVSTALKTSHLTPQYQDHGFWEEERILRHEKGPEIKLKKNKGKN